MILHFNFLKSIIISITNQDKSWTAIEACYDKATDLFTSLKTNECAKEALKKAHEDNDFGCPNCDLYFFCAGNFNAMQCKDSFLEPIGVGDKDSTVNNFNLCIEEAYLRGTQKSFDSKYHGKTASSLDSCKIYLEAEGCNFDPAIDSTNTNADKCYGKTLYLKYNYLIYFKMTLKLMLQPLQVLQPLQPQQFAQV